MGGGGVGDVCGWGLGAGVGRINVPSFSCACCSIACSLIFISLFIVLSASHSLCKWIVSQ